VFVAEAAGFFAPELRLSNADPATRRRRFSKIKLPSPHHRLT
jgi:hypothetical protein